MRHYSLNVAHALVIYYAVVITGGIVSISISVFGTLRSRISSYWFLVAFYAIFTLDIIAILVREYLLLNIETYSFRAIVATYGVNSYLGPAYLLAVVLYLHRALGARWMRTRDWLTVAVAASIGVIYALPGSVRVDIERFAIRLGGAVVWAQIAYLAILAYVVIIGVSSLNRDRTRRELILFVSLIFFGVIGLIESFGGVLMGEEHRVILIGAGAEPPLFSTIPYLVFGGVMTYYFGAYLLSETRPPTPIRQSFAELFSLSPREQEVLQLLNEGYSNREIAEKLYVSLATIKTHAHNIYEKTGVSSRFELFHLQRKE